MLEFIFQGFTEWLYEMALECWEHFLSALLDLLSLDFAYLKTHIPIIPDVMDIMLAVGWSLLLGNLVFQAIKSMMSGLGFDGEDPKLLFTRTFVFAFLLLASPQICQIGLDITSNIVTFLEMPDAVDVHLLDDSAFGSLTAAWLLVIICDAIVMFKVFRLLLEIVERYLVLAMLTITAPLAFATGGSRNTSEIFIGWCRMYGSMCVLTCLNVVFMKMLLSVLSSVPSGLGVIGWMVLVFAIVKVAKKADAIVTRIGLNPAITGEGLGRGLPGMLTYAVIIRHGHRRIFLISDQPLELAIARPHGISGGVLDHVLHPADLILTVKELLGFLGLQGFTKGILDYILCQLPVGRKAISVGDQRMQVFPVEPLKHHFLLRRQAHPSLSL